MAKQNTVLIVDDSKENIDALRSILDELYNVRIALNGNVAIKNMELAKPDLVLLDVLMPNVSGFDVMRKMKSMKDLADIPVIFVTGETDVASEAEGLTLGAYDYITKPYDPEIVYIKVKNQLINKTYRDNLEKLVEQRTREVIASREAIIIGMSLLAEARDKDTGEHIQRMKKYTELIAWKVLELNPGIIEPKQVENCILYAPLHDIGKVGVPDTILRKNGPLTKEEFDEMKKHSVYGADVLRKTELLLDGINDQLNIAVAIAESHHEKYDGTGYPYGKKGDEIPIYARIIALADVYDALTSNRPYKKVFPHEVAMDIIVNGDGRTMPQHFDPRILEAFILVSDKCKEIALTHVTFE